MNESPRYPGTDGFEVPNVVVIERSRLVEAGMVALLQGEGMRAEGSSGSPGKALSLCCDAPKAILLVGDPPPERSALEIPLELRNAGLSNPVIMLIRANGHEFIRRMIRLGVNGLVDRDEAPPT
jgi:DNA-binding NarL/FixJ family response regulator